MNVRRARDEILERRLRIGMGRYFVTGANQQTLENFGERLLVIHDQDMFTFGTGGCRGGDGASSTASIRAGSST